MGVWFQCQFHFWQYSVLLAKSAEDRDIGGHEGSTFKLNLVCFLFFYLILYTLYLVVRQVLIIMQKLQNCREFSCAETRVQSCFHNL